MSLSITMAFMTTSKPSGSLFSSLISHIPVFSDGMQDNHQVLYLAVWLIMSLTVMTFILRQPSHHQVLYLAVWSVTSLSLMMACRTTISPSGSLFSSLINHVPVDHSKGRSALLLVLYLLCSHRQTLSIITRGNQLFSRICSYVIRPDIPAVIYLVLVQTCLCL